MDGFSDLIEFSIALAGFTSIVVVFAHKDEKWNSFDKFRITNALMGSLGSAFLAAIPMGLYYLGFEEELLWKTEAIIVLVYLLFFLISIQARRIKKLSAVDKAQLPKLMVRMIFLVCYLYSFLIIASLMGYTGIEPRALSYFGIILLLLVSVFAFSRLIFYRPVDVK